MTDHFQWGLIHVGTGKIASVLFDTRKEVEGFLIATCRQGLYRVARVAIREVVKVKK